ncbi:extracellular calcium-sensing receptor-like [Leptodactylus fuscus]|uniref:extracellular calcium-sensing receptor-like n=1 Tax=Leptodactylus fuscus TaxID=238119 RepID=UPI003F4E600F
MVLAIIFYISITHFHVCFGRSPACSFQSYPVRGFFQDGDIIIGGFFPIHTSWEEQKYSFTEQIQPLVCDSYSIISYSWMHAMVYAIKEINAIESLLPNTSLGFHILDSCAHCSEALWGTFWTLSGGKHAILNYQCGKKIPPVIIGDAFSLPALTMATVLGTYMYPQVSYTASVPSLNNRLLYPSFFRTIPSDNRQAKALAALVAYMGWNWVGLLSLNEDYGIVGSQVLKEELQNLGVCLAYHETFGQATPLNKLNYIANLVIQSSAKVVIIFSRDPFVHPLMALLLEKDDAKRIWLGTEAWSSSPFLATKKFSKIMMGTLVLCLHKMDIPGFKEYELALRPSTSLPQDIFIENFWELVNNCHWPNQNTTAKNDTVWCTGEEKLTRFRSPKYEYDEFDFRVQYMVYNALFAVAHALHGLMCLSSHDQHGKCQIQKAMASWQIVRALKEVNFKNPMGEEMYFDSTGNPPTDYDVMNWHRNLDESITLVKVGRYNLRESQENDLSMNVTSIRWITGEQEIPYSMCSKSCPPGFRKAAQNGQPMCCFDCIPCSEGEISDHIDSSNCVACPKEMWPNKNNTVCIPKVVEFLAYGEPLGITLTATSIICSLITISILCVFIKYKDTAIVKANNRDITYLLLSCLSISFLCPLLFIGEPQKLTCRFRQGTFGVIFVLGVSCVLAKTVMVVIAFRATKPSSNMRSWMGPKVPASTISLCTSFQFFICVYWMIRCPSFPERNMKIKTEVIIFQCNECSDTLLWCMLGYMALLACVSFFIAFLARKLPDSFNEAKWITFSMLIFLSVWISFVPAYLSTQGKFMVAVEVFGILSSSAGIVGCIFIPKCYIILLRPDLNNRQNLLAKGSTKKT